MRSFKLHQRVRVVAVDVGSRASDEPAGTILSQDVGGVVSRIRRDGGAWVGLDHRVDVPGAHPFPEDDAGGRGNHVLTYPDWCRAERKVRRG